MSTNEKSPEEKIDRVAILRCVHGKRIDEICLECGSAPRKFFGPARVWQEKMKREGKCENCGRKRGESPYKNRCEACGKKPALWARKREGRKKWVKGKKGRPPLTKQGDE